MRVSQRIWIVVGWAWLISCGTHAAADERPLERGDFVMPKEECHITKDGREVPLKGRILPLVVQSVAGEEADVGCGVAPVSSLVRLADADAYYAEWLKRQPKSVDAYHLRSIARMELDDFAGAIADLDAAIELIPNIPRLYTKRASAYLQYRDPQTKKIKFPERVRADCKEALSINRNEVWACCIRLSLKIELEPGLDVARDEDFIRMQVIVPQDAESRQVRGMLFRSFGLAIQAIRDFDAAIEREPYFARCYANRGSAYRLLGKNAEALRDFETAIRLSPKDIAGYTSRCAYYLSANEYQLAVEDAEKSLALAPNDVGVLTAMANLLCSSRDPKLRDGPRALKLAEEAYRIAPGDWRSLNSLGIAHAEAGRLEKAQEYLEQALERKHQMSRIEAHQTAYYINRVRSGVHPTHD